MKGIPDPNTPEYIRLERRCRHLENTVARRNKKLNKEVKGLKAENKALKLRISQQDRIIETLKLQIEELRKMIFGKKKKRHNHHNNPSATISKSKSDSKRSPNSFRRPMPNKDEITEIVNYPIRKCPDCGTPLEKFKLVTRYLEDIRLLENVLKKAEKQQIQTGYCPHCQKRVSAKPISSQTVYLGANIKQFICYCNIILRLSFSQTRNLLKDLAKIHISDGEISNILETQAKKLLPQYHSLKAKIRGQPAAHYDETGYPVQKEYQGRWAWVMTGAETEDTVFRLGQSRGKGNADKLKGKNTKQVAITDDYGVYRTLFENHQLCWAHILRKTRDLTNSDQLPQEKQKHCQKVYEALNILYQDLKTTLEESFDVENRKQIREEMIKRLEEIAILSPKDPVKLKTIKQTLLKNKEKYFTCLLHRNIPTTNNKAERALRHLVLKRKNSYGSKTQKGADVMSVLCSVLLSLWWSRPKNFFKEYSALLNAG